MNSLRWRRHRGLVLALVVGIISLVAFFGDARLSALTSSERSTIVAPSDTKKTNIKGAVSLFDDDLVHEIEFTFDPAAYARMMQTYQAHQIKDFIEATVTIDGTAVASVGIRLKGNSTLGSLRRAGPTGGNVGGRGGGGGGPGGVILSADEPESLPWLIKFDEFVKGQSYEGYEQLALRPASGAGLAEALALDLVGVAGEPTQRSMYTSLSVNGAAAAVLRLVVEIPDSEYADDNFRSDGVLYKALSTGRFTYLSDDPLAYANAFKQITNKKQQDLKPLIELMKWVTQASDAEFAAHLDEHVDVESFAAYVAIQDLLANFDDMSGPGSNYYLWYDLETSRFTVLSWDMNLAFGGLGRGGGVVNVNPGGVLPPGGVNLPPPGAVFVGPGGGPGGPGGFGGRGGHALKAKFIAEPTFAALRDQARAKAKQAIYGSGAATTELARLKTLVASSGLISGATIDSEAAALLARIQQLATAP